MSPAPRILLVEDNPADAVLVREYLRDWPRGAVTIVHAADLASAELALNGQAFDLVLLDCRLPDARNLEGYRRLMLARPALPIVLLTGLDDDALAMQAIEAGVQDYLTKDRLDPDRLHRAIRYSIERQRIQTELQQRSAELERVNQVMTTFLATASHELRTPMTGVLAATEILTEHGASESPAAVAEFAYNIGTAAQRLSTLVDRILELAELQSRSQPLPAMPVDLGRLLRKLADELAATATADIRIHGAEQPVLVEGEPTRLSRMFAELLDNAVRYAPPGTEVTVTLAPCDDGCDVHVDDRGPGIPDPERRQLVFEPFFQTGHVLTDKPAGLGLGLTIARETALLHGGSMECTASPGGGARFTVHLLCGARTAPALSPQA